MKRISRGLVGLIAMASLFMAVNGGSALAATKGHFVPTEATTTKWSGSLTVTKGGADPKTCTMPATQSSSVKQPAVAFVYQAGDPYGSITLACTGGTSFRVVFGIMYAEFDAVTGWRVRLYEFPGKSLPGAIFASPWGNWIQNGPVTAFATWTNASGETPSQITFNNQLMGETQTFQAIRISGTLNVTTGTGGSLTLST
jgi:hypothetical protein